MTRKDIQSIPPSAIAGDTEKAIQYINLKLAYLGMPTYGHKKETGLIEIAEPLLRVNKEKQRLVQDYTSPVGQRIENFLNDYFAEENGGSRLKLPSSTFSLDYPGLARIMSLPPDADVFVSEIVSSYRLKQGVLHNPAKDRRTTQGVFHVAEGGLPIPDDKIAIPKTVFRNLFLQAFNAPPEIMKLPFTSTQEKQAELFVSLLMRPTVCPEIPGISPAKTLEIRFFAPGSLVSNLDFVESIFGNAGNPFLPENDAALDVDHWTGHTGCVILAPHLTRLRKKDLGLPHYDQATKRQREDGMCWKKEDELYNGGSAFKATCRDERGVIVTIIADNYFGYCKKEVKTQISYSANLFGMCEEEHSGGAFSCTSYDLGVEFALDETLAKSKTRFCDLKEILGEHISIYPEGYAVDRQHTDLVYVPEDAKFHLPSQSITWQKDGKEQKIKLLTHHTYMLPSGYKVFIKKQTGGQTWHLIGTVAEGVLCHKPCTVSGGGKSEISKSIVDAMIQGPVFVADFHKDMDMIEEILKKDFTDRYKPEFSKGRQSRPILSTQRSLGSVIKLMTPHGEYTDAYNSWLYQLPHHLRDILFCVKRFYRPEWGNNWREHFHVDVVNGRPGHELKYQNQKLVANYLRVGREKDGSWRIYRVRQDFAAAEKLQFADDITASVVIPKERLKYLDASYHHPSVKLISNCENFLFQRPDDAIYRGYDKQAEADLATSGSFLSNFEPLTRDDARALTQDSIHFDLYSDPMKRLIYDFFYQEEVEYFASSAHPRIVDGKPSKNPRYLQRRPDHANPKQKYLAETAIRLFRKIPFGNPVYFPVNAVLPGRRMNPPEPKNNVPALAVYNPIHFQELPELFLEFISSLTGKSPSTTGFGSEGALTKGPFNALPPIIDLNNAFVSFAVCAYDGFSSAAGYIGPNYRVDHDISLLIPEIWSRMTVQEQEAKYLIEQRYLDKMRDFDYEGRKVPASILGYRINQRFTRAFLGRIFNSPDTIFTDDMLAPEKQDLRLFVEGIDNIMATYKRVAEHYFADGSVEWACPPLKALLHIMAHGHYNGKDLNSPEIRQLFSRESVVAADWYRERLSAKQQADIALWTRHVHSLEVFLGRENQAEVVDRMKLRDRLAEAKKHLEEVKSPSYLNWLHGTIGADPFAFKFKGGKKERIAAVLA